MMTSVKYYRANLIGLHTLSLREVACSTTVILRKSNLRLRGTLTFFEALILKIFVKVNRKIDTTCLKKTWRAACFEPRSDEGKIFTKRMVPLWASQPRLGSETYKRIICVVNIKLNFWTTLNYHHCRGGRSLGGGALFKLPNNKNFYHI